MRRSKLLTTGNGPFGAVETTPIRDKQLTPEQLETLAHIAETEAKGEAYYNRQLDTLVVEGKARNQAIASARLAVLNSLPDRLRKELLSLHHQIETTRKGLSSANHRAKAFIAAPKDPLSLKDWITARSDARKEAEELSEMLSLLEIQFADLLPRLQAGLFQSGHQLTAATKAANDKEAEKIRQQIESLKQRRNDLSAEWNHISNAAYEVKHMYAGDFRQYVAHNILGESDK